MQSEELSSSKAKSIGYLCNGINLDHIPCGNAWYIIKVLNLQQSARQIGVGLNLPSPKLGLKDLIKIENGSLTQDEINAISLFCVGSTLSVIENYQVVKKMVIGLPEVISNIVVCPNQRCVSHQHASKFRTTNNRHGKVGLACHYCEQIFALDEVKNYKI